MAFTYRIWTPLLLRYPFMGPRVRLDTVDLLRVVWMVAVKIIQIRFQNIFIQKERSCALTDSPILSRSMVIATTII